MVSHDVHTGKYGQVDMAPLTAVQAAADLVARDWGEDYSIGLVGPVDVRHLELQSTPDRKEAWVFQVLAVDGSRFAVYSDRYGNAGLVMGRKALALLQKLGIEAYVPVLEDV